MLISFHSCSSFSQGSAERWDRIAGKVEGKSKEQCMARFASSVEDISSRTLSNALRFKQLAEQVKRKKAEAAE